MKTTQTTQTTHLLKIVTAKIPQGQNKLAEVDLARLVLVHQRECHVAEYAPLQLEMSIKFVQAYLPATVRVDFQKAAEQSVDVVHGDLQLFEVKHGAFVLAGNSVIRHKDELRLVIVVPNSSSDKFYQ